MPATPEAPWRVIIEFTGVDLDDDDAVDTLASNADMHLGFRSSELVTTVDAVVPADSFHTAFVMVVEAVCGASPDADVLRLVDPLVTVSDIADEAGVTRQAVRNWSLGLRQSGFPRPIAVVGDGVRVWRQADVDTWLSQAVELGTGHRYGPASSIARFNESLEGGVEVDDDGFEWSTASSRTEVQSERVRRRGSMGPRVRPTASTTSR